MRKVASSFLLVFLGLPLLSLSQAAKRSITLDDLARFKDVADPQMAPDGKWIAYTVSAVDTEADKKVTQIWLTSWDGSQQFQMTRGPESAGAPRWSPDSNLISFVSSRPGQTKGSQVWAIDRRGGEAYQVTHFKNFDISAQSWSPDGIHLVLVLKEKEEPEEDEKKSDSKPAKPPKPIVIDRYHFKQDMDGYLSSKKRNHIYLFDTKSEKLEQITNGSWDETNAVMSPDGSKIAFVSSADKDPDRTDNSDIFVVEARAQGNVRKLTDWPGPDHGPLSWSPDSKRIAYVQESEGKFSAYSMSRLAVVAADGGPAKVVSPAFDRPMSHPEFAADGSHVLVLVADDRVEYPARVESTSDKAECLVEGQVTISSLSSDAGHTALLASSDTRPAEVFALDDGKMRKITSHNDALVAELNLASAEDISFKSKDGTDVHGLLTRPLNYAAGKKAPLLLRIHGGPNGQDAHAFSFERQLFAANGYADLNVNYRGSSGRGHKFGESIFADWGNKEVADLLAGVNHVIEMGIADPQHLAIGGWSYGGILTDYTVAGDGRFKAAISGAGSANQISMYGVDQYTFQYDTEVGAPWKNPQAWMNLSYAFFHADRIRTPTLFMGGDKDFNVPLIGGEQMYQALQTLGVPTELVIYPGEFHGFKRPSFIRDRYERYLAWYAKWLKQ